MGHTPLPGTQASMRVSAVMKRAAVAGAANRRLAGELGAAVLAALDALGCAELARLQGGQGPTQGRHGLARCELAV